MYEVDELTFDDRLGHIGRGWSRPYSLLHHEHLARRPWRCSFGINLASYFSYEGWTLICRMHKISPIGFGHEMSTKRNIRALYRTRVMRSSETAAF